MIMKSIDKKLILIYLNFIRTTEGLAEVQFWINKIKDKTMPNSNGMAGSQHNIIAYNNDSYTPNINSQQNRRTLRDLSTGILKRSMNNKLAASKDNSLKIEENPNASRSIQTKSVYENSAVKSRLPQIMSIDSRQYKTKLSRVGSKINTGLNLTNQEKTNILEKQKQKILESVLQDHHQTTNYNQQRIVTKNEMYMAAERSHRNGTELVSREAKSLAYNENTKTKRSEVFPPLKRRY